MSIISLIICIIIIVAIVVSPKYPIVGAIIGFITMSIGVAGAAFLAFIITVDFNPALANLFLVIGFGIWLILTFGIISSYLGYRKALKEKSKMYPVMQNSKEPNPQKSNTDYVSGLNTGIASFQIEKLTFQDKIQMIDIGSKNTAVFFYKDGTGMKLQLKNLARIVQEIINEFHRNEFRAGELENHFNYVKENYVTNLNPIDYSIVLRVVERFVKEGGKLDVITT